MDDESYWKSFDDPFKTGQAADPFDMDNLLQNVSSSTSTHKNKTTAKSPVSGKYSRHKHHKSSATKSNSRKHRTCSDAKSHPTHRNATQKSSVSEHGISKEHRKISQPHRTKVILASRNERALSMPVYDFADFDNRGARVEHSRTGTKLSSSTESDSDFDLASDSEDSVEMSTRRSNHFKLHRPKSEQLESPAPSDSHSYASSRVDPRVRSQSAFGPEDTMIMTKMPPRPRAQTDFGMKTIVTDAMEFMKKGSNVLKLCRTGRPHYRRLKLSQDNQVISWSGGLFVPRDHKVLICDISSLKEGHTTANFARVQVPTREDLSFSLLFVNATQVKRDTLDFVCNNMIDYRLWIEGIGHLLAARHSVLSLGDIVDCRVEMQVPKGSYPNKPDTFRWKVVSNRDIEKRLSTTSAAATDLTETPPVFDKSKKSDHDDSESSDYPSGYSNSSENQFLV